jgi:hypothetical protein
MTAESAEILGLQALAWLAGTPQALERFMDACAIEGADLRAAAERPETLAAVLGFLLSNEALLLDFCNTAAIAPERVAQAGARLEANI